MFKKPSSSLRCNISKFLIISLVISKSNIFSFLWLIIIFTCYGTFFTLSFHFQCRCSYPRSSSSTSALFALKEIIQLCQIIFNFFKTVQFCYFELICFSLYISSFIFHKFPDLFTFTKHILVFYLV